MITSTLLTLLLMPTLYAMVEPRKERQAEEEGGQTGEEGRGRARSSVDAESDEPEPAQI